MSTFANTLISHNYTWRAAALRPELVQHEKEPALAFGLGISIPRSEGQDKWGLIPYPGVILAWTWAWRICSIHAPWVGGSLSTPCSSQSSLNKSTWASLLPQCGLHMDRKESKETLHIHVALLRTVPLLRQDQLELSEWWGLPSWKLLSNHSSLFHGYVLSYHNLWEHAS